MPCEKRRWSVMIEIERCAEAGAEIVEEQEGRRSSHRVRERNAVEEAHAAPALKSATFIAARLFFAHQRGYCSRSQGMGAAAAIAAAQCARAPVGDAVLNQLAAGEAMPPSNAMLNHSHC